MLRCNEVTRLYASEEIDGAPLKTRLAVRLHLMMCEHCRRYVRELARIGEAARSLAGSEARDADRDEALLRRVLPDSTEPPG